LSLRPNRDNNETRITGESGGSKGSKNSRLDLIPAEPLDELSRVYGMGAEKYSDVNYLRGYNYRLSLGAMLRHIQAWNLGEDYDEESGLHHLAHAAWHCNTLMMFQWNGLGNDDRIQPALDGGYIESLDNE
jgi:hypothetical protein